MLKLKRLRRARNAAIVVAIVFYFVAKVWGGKEFFRLGEQIISVGWLPLIVSVFVTAGELAENWQSATTAASLAIQVCCLAVIVLSAILAYGFNALVSDAAEKDRDERNRNG